MKHKGFLFMYFLFGEGTIILLWHGGVLKPDSERIKDERERDRERLPRVFKQNAIIRLILSVCSRM